MMHRSLFTLISLIALLMLCTPTRVAEPGGGGASETVASIVPWENTFKVVVAGDSPFTVTAEVCSDSFSPLDTTYFHMNAVITDLAPEWVVPYFPDMASSIVITNSADSTAVLMKFVKSVAVGKKPWSDTLERYGVVEGVVSAKQTDGDTLPASGVKVFIQGTYFETSTNSDGSYFLRGIPRGLYTIYVAAVNRKWNTPVSEPVTVVISGDTTVTKNIVLPQN